MKGRVAMSADFTFNSQGPLNSYNMPSVDLFSNGSEIKIHATSLCRVVLLYIMYSQ